MIAFQDLPQWAQAGGAAGILALSLAYLYRRLQAIHHERIESFKKVVEAKERRIKELHDANKELYERLLKNDNN